MATEIVAPPPIPTTDDEEVGKKVSEEKKAGEEDDVPLTKQNGEEILKTEEAYNHEKIEPPVVVAEKIVDAPVSDIPLVDAVKVGNDPNPDILEQVVEAEKSADAAVSDVSVEESKVESDPSPDIPEQVVDAVKITEEVDSATECVVKEAPKEPAIEIIEEGQVEQPKTVDAPQSSYEAIEKPKEPLEVATTDKESVETVLTEIKESEPESLEVQKLEVAAAEVDEKAGELCEVTQEVEMKVDEVELEKSVQDETVKDEGSAADKVEPIPFLEEGKTEAENKPSLEVEETPEQPKIEEEKTHDEVVHEKCLEDDIVKDEEFSADKVEASTILEEEKTDKDYEPSEVKSSEEVLVNRDRADYSVPHTTEPVASEELKKEIAEVDVVEKLPTEEAAVEIEKVGGEVEVLETEETEKDTVVIDYSTEPIQEEEKIEVVEEVAEETSVKLGTVGKENVETVEIEEKEKSNVVTEESTQAIELDQKKDLSGLDVVEKLTEEAAADVEQLGEKNAETEDGKSVVTEGIILPILEDEKKELSGADVMEKLAEETAMKLEEVEEENMGKVAETIECEKKDVIIEDSSEPILVDQKEVSSGVEVVEKVAEDARVEFEKVGEENETKNVQSDDSDGKNVLDEVLTQKDKADATSYIITPSAVIGKLFVGGGKDVEPAAEYIKDETPGTVETKQEDNVEQKQDEVTPLATEPLGESKPCEPEVKGDEYVTLEKTIEDVTECDPAAKNEKAEHIKDETPGLVETKKEDNVEEKQVEVTTLVTEPLGESKPSEPEVKGDEPVTLEKTIEDVAKSDDKYIELPAKDGDDTKPSEDLPKEVPAKPSHKQSTTILSKVKQTLVKAKRVITGKSPSSKTPASETKDEIKVK